MQEIRVKADVSGVLKRLKRIHADQVPFATSSALNSTIFDVRRQIVGPTWDDAFEVRNKRFPSAAFRVDKATKRQLRARVYDYLGRASIRLHAEGGIKRPKGRSLAIPTSNIKRTSSGKISKAQKPAHLKRAFRATMPSGQEVIAQRVGKPRLPIRILYNLEPGASIRKELRFYEDAAREARRTYERHWKKSFVRAIRTAR